MTEDRMNEIRKFFWNYKYQENCDLTAYEMACELVQYIDKLKSGKEPDGNFRSA